MASQDRGLQNGRHWYQDNFYKMKFLLLSTLTLAAPASAVVYGYEICNSGQKRGEIKNCIAGIKGALKVSKGLFAQGALLRELGRCQAFLRKLNKLH